MTPEFIAVHEDMTVGQALDHVRKAATKDADLLRLRGGRSRPPGRRVPLRRLITADPATPSTPSASAEVVSVGAEMDQEEVARLVTKHGLFAVPVVSREDRLLGTITVDDVIDVIHEEATEDIHRLAGVSADETIFDPPTKAIRRRFVLAPWLPARRRPGGDRRQPLRGVDRGDGDPRRVHADRGGMGGNAGIQTFTVIVRAIALGDLTHANTRKVLARELLIGLANGVGMGLVAGVIAFLWKGSAMLGIVLGVAMITNMVVAALAGTLIPVVLKSLRVDPAVATGVLVTTLTDCAGFLSFLGLATLMLRFLQ